jgi:hypothetical protein
MQPQQKMKTMKMTPLQLRNSISRSRMPRRSPARLRDEGGSLITVLLLALAFFALLPSARADDDDRGGGNTAEGAFALSSNTTGINNTANGDDALAFNRTGSYNTATGNQALLSNTTGNGNTATGLQALLHNTTGSYNTANGYGALFKNTGTANTATGADALFNNTTGMDNTATGGNALYSNTSGIYNTANGVGTLKANTTGGNNTANGFQALYLNTTGASNIALGVHAGYNLTTGSNNIDIGNVGVAGEFNKIRIGTVGTQTATFIAGIHGVGVTGAAVIVSSSGQLGVAPSSQRFKAEIKPMEKASEAILALKPVTFHYKPELDPKGTPQFGLVAEEVEKVDPDLVVRDAEGKVFTVRYEAVNAMLLNEFLKEHGKVEKLEAIIAKQQKQIDALTTGLQKVSDRLAMGRARPTGGFKLSKTASKEVAKNQ